MVIPDPEVNDVNGGKLKLEEMRITLKGERGKEKGKTRVVVVSKVQTHTQRQTGRHPALLQFENPNNLELVQEINYS